MRGTATNTAANEDEGWKAERLEGKTDAASGPFSLSTIQPSVTAHPVDFGCRAGPRLYNEQVKAGWHVVPWNVIFRDLDAIGHVNNAVYFTYFEWGRTRYWFDLQGGAKPFDIGFIVAHAECDFRAQLGMEPIEIATRIGEMRTSSIDFHSEVRKADGTVAATGNVVVVLYDWATQSKTTIPDELRRKVRLFQGEE